MEEKTIKDLKSKIQAAIDKNIPLQQLYKGEEYNKIIEQLAQINFINDSKEAIEIINLFKKALAIKGEDKEKVISQPDQKDRGSKIDQIRDKDGKIIKYTFEIFVRDKPSVIGTLSREEMQMIYRLYTNYGSKLTQREVSRFFPEYSLEDFKRILRAFNITKASAPFAPHIIEETPKDQLLNMQFREKENDFLRSLEVEKVRRNESELKKQAEEIIKLKEQLTIVPNFLKDIDLTPIEPLHFTPTQSDRVLFLWLSDMHIGASVSDTSDYDNYYDEYVVRTRINKIVEHIALLNIPLKKIVICNLGDSLDGMDNQTCRRDHYLPQNLDNKAQFKTFISSILFLVRSLKENVKVGSIEYNCVGSSNHDGDYGWAANYALGQILEKSNIPNIIFDTFMDYVNEFNTSFIICHGKDSRDMKSGLPLVINDKTAVYINDYIAYNKDELKDNIIFVKGDLHQSAISYGHNFKYHSVGSFFGASEWVHKNFGNTQAVCDYSILDSKNNIIDGQIKLQ